MEIPAIQIENLSKVYENVMHKNKVMQTVFSNINLNIKQGEFHVLIGRSGCGKSTLINIIAGFIDKTNGRIYVNGKEVVKPGQERGVVFQNAHTAIYPWLTVYENVEFGLKMRNVERKKRQEITEQYIQLVGLNEHKDKYPEELSGGMKQRVQLARVLANDSQILIMDEPFGALDAQTRRSMQNELVRIWRKTNKTIIFVTHDIQEAVLLGQRVSVMSNDANVGIIETYEINFPYPRNELSKEFTDKYRQIMTHFDFNGEIRVKNKSEKRATLIRGT